MFKYTIFAYILLIFLMLFELDQLLPIKKQLEKRVLGISTQIKEIENYENFTSENSFK